MDNTFPVILYGLRKERGLSQKEAAAQLGISQALLSHYEKGIRECGHSFLIKVADFYGVTCDYLLGRTTSRNYRGGLEDLAENEKNDTTPSLSTFVKAGILLSDYMRKNNTYGSVRIDNLIAIEIYKLILIQASAGNLPKNWAGRAFFDNQVCATDMYLSIIDSAAEALCNPSKNKNPLPDAEIPVAISTLVSIAEDFVVRDCTKKTPPLPSEFLR
ncbi:MAG: helix-turn-helix transcriptional regulator [Clostridia bacterium]|nr:helix-turn-helix transcriptional regulator [Clostridia bacterium]